MFWLTYRCALLPGCSYFLSSGLHLSAVLRCSSWVESTSVRDSRYHECNPGFLISSSGLSPDIRASQPKVDPHHRIMMHPTHQRSSCPSFGGAISLLPSFNCSFSPEIRLCPPDPFCVNPSAHSPSHLSPERSGFPLLSERTLDATFPDLILFFSICF